MRQPIESFDEHYYDRMNSFMTACM